MIQKQELSIFLEQLIHLEEQMILLGCENHNSVMELKRWVIDNLVSREVSEMMKLEEV